MSQSIETIGAVTAAAGTVPLPNALLVTLSLIQHSPDNVRRIGASPEADAGMAAAIAKGGVLEPVLLQEVDGGYRVVAVAPGQHVAEGAAGDLIEPGDAGGNLVETEGSRDRARAVSFGCRGHARPLRSRPWASFSRAVTRP